MSIFEDTDIISGYSRAQAIKDGTLVDLTGISRLFRYPVAVTSAVWAGCIEWPEDIDHPAWQNQEGRLSDVLWMTFCAIRRNSHTDRVTVELLVVPRDRKVTEPELITLEAVCGPGDDAEPVITIQFPGED
jgi:hypothetical protein